LQKEKSIARSLHSIFILSGGKKKEKTERRGSLTKGGKKGDHTVFGARSRLTGFRREKKKKEKSDDGRP